MTRLVILSDLHCGHRAGLTPPGWQTPLEAPDRLAAYARQQRVLWSWYAATIAALQPIDVLVVNGDAIDGRGSRSGGTELITTDLSAQAGMAVQCIAEAKAGAVHVVAGTPYHSGPDGEDWEERIADALGGVFHGHLWLPINGVMFDCKHKVGSSSVPHGRHTAISRERIWNLMWHEREGAPKSDVIVRSHVHYHEYSGNPTHLAMTTPALQGWGSKYGERQCSGIVDIGLVSFDISNEGAYTWQPHLLRVKHPQA